jgi:hypothetical protein
MRTMSSPRLAGACRTIRARPTACTRSRRRRRTERRARCRMPSRSRTTMSFRAHDTVLSRAGLLRARLSSRGCNEPIDRPRARRLPDLRRQGIRARAVARLIARSPTRRNSPTRSTTRASLRPTSSSSRRRASIARTSRPGRTGTAPSPLLGAHPRARASSSTATGSSASRPTTCRRRSRSRRW